MNGRSHQVGLAVALALAAALAGCTDEQGRVTPTGSDDEQPHAIAVKDWPMEGANPGRTYQYGEAFDFKGLNQTWDQTTGQERIVGLSWAHGRLLATTRESIHVLQPSTGQIERTLPALTQMDIAALVSDGTLLAVGIDEESGSTGAYQFVSFGVGDEGREIQGELGGFPSINRGAVIYEEASGAVRSVSVDSGETEWEFVSPDIPEGDSTAMSGLLVTDDAVYAGMHEAILYAIDRESGEQLWKYDHPGGSVIHGPSTDGPRVYLVTNSDPREVVTLDAATGELLWSYFTGATIPHPPLVADGMLFAYSWDGWVYAFDAATGTREWTFQVEEESCHGLRSCGKDYHGIAYASGNLLVPGRDGVLYVLDGKTGAVLDQEPMPVVDLVAPVARTVTPIIVDGTAYLGIGNRVFAFDLDGPQA